jgi:O-antigen/teichoic acid export membrane protein
MDFNRERIKLLVVGGMPFLMLGALLGVYKNIDVVMLRFMTSEDVVGWHSAAFRIYGALEFLPAVLMAALLPTLARMYKAQAPDTGTIASRSLGVVLLVMVPVGLGMSLTAPEVIAFMPYPDTFVNTVPVLTLLALSAPVTAVLIVFGAIAAAVDRQVAWAYAMLGTVVLNIALNVLAIPYFQDVHGNGGIGAAAATLVSESVMVLIAIALVPKDLFTRHLAAMGAKVAACGGLMALAVFFGKGADLGLFPLVGIGVVAYMAPAFLIRAVTPQDIAFLRTAMKRRKEDRPVDMEI